MLFEESTIDKKELFLNSIRRKNKTRSSYKRVISSTLRYAGGKSLAVGYIVELIPPTIKRLVSPFFGGGSIELAINKHLNIAIKGYDIFDILVNYWNIQINQPLKLYSKLKQLGHLKDDFLRIKKILKHHWEGISKLSEIDLAAHYFHNHNLSYGPMFLGWYSSNYKETRKYLSMIERVKNFNIGNITVDCKSFEEVIPKHSNDFLYLDPPYYLEGDSKMWKAMYPNCNFPIHHKDFNP